MIDLIIFLLSTFSLTFLLKELNGPFDIISNFRGYLFRSKFGVFFYKLFECYYCLGFWASMIIYLILFKEVKLDIILYLLSGSISNLFLERLLNEKVPSL